MFALVIAVILSVNGTETPKPVLWKGGYETLEACRADEAKLLEGLATFNRAQENLNVATACHPMNKQETKPVRNNDVKAIF